MVDAQDDEDEPEYNMFTVGDKKKEKIEVIIEGCKSSLEYGNRFWSKY